MTFSNEEWDFVRTVRQLLINRSLLIGFFGSWDALKWPLPLLRGGRCREAKIRVNV